MSGGPQSAGDGARRRSPRALVAVNCLGLLLFAGFLGLGVWQVQRRAWKLDLIARVEARVHAAPVAAPGPPEWPEISAARDAYRHVAVTGVLEDGATSLVQAVTALGGGFWVLTALRGDAGFTVLINRGFVPADKRDPATWSTPRGRVDVTGLLRVSEPGGAFLRANAPSAGRWYSRDVAAIARSHGLSDVAPYFIDADVGADPKALPLGGLTVVSFRNDHLAYALTWFALAAMTAGALTVLDRGALRDRPPPRV